MVYLQYSNKREALTTVNAIYTIKNKTIQSEDHETSFVHTCEDLFKRNVQKIMRVAARLNQIYLL